MYQKSVANEAGATGRLVVFENGAQLTRVNTDAACDALPGSFVNPYSSGTANPVTIKIHPFGSTNASSDGKTYEVQFDDWMYLIDEHVMLNKAVMSKFGVRLGEVTLAFHKP